MTTRRTLEKAMELVESFGTCRPAETVATTVQVIAWWESRRLLYNALLLGAGLAAFVVLLAVTLLGSALDVPVSGLPGDYMIPCFAATLAVVLVNVAYTVGWLAELLLPRAARRPQERIPAAAWTAGALVSVSPIFLMVPLSLAQLGVGLVARPGAEDMVGTWMNRGGWTAEAIVLRPDRTWHETWTTPDGALRSADGTWSHDGRTLELRDVVLVNPYGPDPVPRVSLSVRRRLLGGIALEHGIDLQVDLRKVPGSSGEDGRARLRAVRAENAPTASCT